MAPNPVNKRERGFTLIEVMIAMVLTAIAIMGIIALYITETKASGFSRHTTEAAVLAEDKVEKIRTMASTNIASTIESNLNERGQTGGGGIFKRTYSQTQMPVGSPLYADIAVTVSWTDDGGVAHSLTVHARRNL